MESRGPKNIISATDEDYHDKLFRAEKAIVVIYATNCKDSLAALFALPQIATEHENILFVTVKGVIKKPENQIQVIAQKIHDQAGVKEYPTLVAYENYVMKDKMVSEKSSIGEQSETFEEFISKNFPPKISQEDGH